MSQGDDLGGYISWGPTAKEKILREVYIRRKPEVYDDWFEINLANHDVLGLQIPVHDSILAEMTYPPQQPLNYCFYFLLAES